MKYSLYQNRTVSVSETTGTGLVAFVMNCKSKYLASGTSLPLFYPYFLIFSQYFITGYLNAGCFKKIFNTW